MIKRFNSLLIHFLIYLVFLTNCSPTVLVNKDYYQHCILSTSIKSNNNKIQEFFGEDKVDFFLKGNIIIAKKKMLVKQNGTDVENAFEYYLVNRSDSHYKTINFFSFKKDFWVAPHNIIDSIFSNIELLNKIKGDDYYHKIKKKNQAVNTVILSGIKNKVAKTYQIDSIVFSYLRKNKDLIMPLWKIENFSPVVNLELYSRMPDSSLNNVIFKITKEDLMGSTFLDSVLLKYEQYLK